MLASHHLHHQIPTRFRSIPPRRLPSLLSPPMMISSLFWIPSHLHFVVVAITFRSTRIRISRTSKETLEFWCRGSERLRGLGDLRGMTSVKSSRSRTVAAPRENGGAKFEENLNVFKTDHFDADSYLQSKCSLNEKVRVFNLVFVDFCVLCGSVWLWENVGVLLDSGISRESNEGWSGFLSLCMVNCWFCQVIVLFGMFWRAFDLSSFKNFENFGFDMVFIIAILV